MKRKRKRNTVDPNVLFHQVGYKIDGIPYTIFCCARCSRAWKLRDPVEAWRVKTLMSHAGSHNTDEMVEAKLAEHEDHHLRTKGSVD